MIGDVKSRILDWPEAGRIFRQYLNCWRGDLAIRWCRTVWAACVRNGLLIYGTEEEERQARIVPVVLSLFYYEYCSRTAWCEHENFRPWSDPTWRRLKAELLDHWEDYEGLIHKVKIATFDHIGDYEHAAELWISCLEAAHDAPYDGAKREEAYQKLMNGVWNDFNYERGRSFVLSGDIDDKEKLECIVTLPDSATESIEKVRDTILSDLVARECKRIVNKSIRWLQSLKEENLLSGDDSVLKNAWDEICVQVQNEYSVYWDAYELTMRQAIESAMFGLDRNIIRAIWLETDSGRCWIPEEDGEPEVEDEEVIQYILRDHLIPKAEAWSNKRIEFYLDNYC